MCTRRLSTSQATAQCRSGGTPLPLLTSSCPWGTRPANGPRSLQTSHPSPRTMLSAGDASPREHTGKPRTLRSVCGVHLAFALDRHGGAKRGGRRDRFQETLELSRAQRLSRWRRATGAMSQTPEWYPGLLPGEHRTRAHTVVTRPGRCSAARLAASLLPQPDDSEAVGHWWRVVSAGVAHAIGDAHTEAVGQTHLEMPIRG